MIPMLMEREPAPIIDVSKPALPKNRPFSQRYGYTDANGFMTAKGVLETLSDFPRDYVAVDLADPGGDMTAAVKYWVDANGCTHVKSFPQVAVYIDPAALEPEMTPGNPLVGPKPAVDRRVRAVGEKRFKIGDQIMVGDNGISPPVPAIFVEYYDNIDVIKAKADSGVFGWSLEGARHPTLAERARYWPATLNAIEREFNIMPDKIWHRVES